MKLPIPGSQLLKPGVVLELLVPTKPQPKYKFCAFCSDDDPPLFFLINSSINEYIAQKAHLAEQQVIVPATELDHRLHKDSYLDCSQAFDHFTRSDLHAALDENNGCYMGRLSDAVLAQVAMVVSASMTIRPIERYVILAAISD